MTSHIFASPELWNWSGVFSWRARRPASEYAGADAARARREFVNEMLERSPDAFNSELDVQAMMHMFPGRF